MIFKSNYQLEELEKGNGWLLSYPQINKERMNPGQPQFYMERKPFQSFPTMLDFVKIHQEELENYIKANAQRVQ